MQHINGTTLLITGPSGSGKNYILDQYANRGVFTFDLDKLGSKVQRDDGAVKWVIDVAKVRDLLNEYVTNPKRGRQHVRRIGGLQYPQKLPAIVCGGTCDNIAEVAALFDEVIILRISAATYNRVATAKRAWYEKDGKVAPAGWWKPDGGDHWLKKRDAILSIMPPGTVMFLDNDRAYEAKGAYHQNG